MLDIAAGVGPVYLNNPTLYRVIQLSYTICNYVETDMPDEQTRRFCEDVKKKAGMIAWVARVIEIAG